MRRAVFVVPHDSDAIMAPVRPTRRLVWCLQLWQVVERNLIVITPEADLVQLLQRAKPVAAAFAIANARKRRFAQ